MLNESLLVIQIPVQRIPEFHQKLNSLRSFESLYPRGMEPPPYSRILKLSLVRWFSIEKIINSSKAVDRM